VGGLTAERYLEGRHAIVTGGGRGIGAAIAAELAGRGAAVSLLGRSVEALEHHASELARQHGVRSVAVRCDVAREDDVRAAFTRAAAELGAAHVLVNNAGQSESAPLAATDPALWNRLLAVDLTGPYLCIREALPPMLEAGWGRIINIASTAGLRGYNRLSAYCAAKHGLVGLTRALAQETAKRGVTVNAVCPGYTDTGMAAQAVENLVAGLGTTPAEARAMITRVIPRGVLTRPEEVASLVGWLCAPEAAAVTGQAIAAAGGEV
jgi:NAD(P)-dependent dehydrogenase (short-subunit alcohol dehydrogenase family)